MGVSGGADSMCLLHVLCCEARELGVQLTVAHLDHRIRGTAAREDAAFVEDAARKCRIEFISARSDVPRRARNSGVSLEMAAREARYAFFARTAGRIGADAAATAHNANDQAETVLLKLARGAGSAGLAGIKYCSEINGLSVVRPLLDVGRDQIIDYLKVHNLAWREDESNMDVGFLRNRVRHEVIPMLQRAVNPGIRDSLRRTAAVMRADDDWLEVLSDEILSECLTADNAGLDVSKTVSQPLAARRRVIRKWLSSQGVAPEIFDFASIDRINALLDRIGGTAVVPVGSGWSVRRSYGCLLLTKAATVVPRPFRAALSTRDETIVPEAGLKITLQKGRGYIKVEPRGAGVLPADATVSSAAVGRKRIYVRSWKPGDRMKSLGLKGSKKIQDIFVDAKLSREQRHTVPVIECGGQIIWIPGYRIARGWEVPGETAPCIRIGIERI
jgi:tRNA(Ile)-lysidine synthase